MPLGPLRPDDSSRRLYPTRNFKNAPIALQEYYNYYLAAAAADKLYNDDDDDNRITITAAAPRV
ncbi:hypothetical protein L249_8315 [Ophiocordyceps polyrhachis-furcata BCC 54312]|uniref:Uncharacterized protein n=1 Tax=Ophiocordyceps polyrhachis-furcata BCC 54312 TaxID=1330021 RepID=A0A367LH62_9HYPO|nr:hypothetical protein L249_8315 [Ophiocordyceps polyrhachis-furcata BCC 54312]